MKRPLPLPDQAALKELLDYEPTTGIFTWKESNANKIAGCPAGGRTSRGYIRIWLLGGYWLAHRLAWVWVHGDDIRSISIDHADRNRSNNAIANLRKATASQQGQNKCAPLGVSGRKGVSLRRKGRPWRAEIKVSGKTIFLGSFDTVDDAHAAYISAAKKYFGEFARAE